MRGFIEFVILIGAFYALMTFGLLDPSTSPEPVDQVRSPDRKDMPTLWRDALGQHRYPFALPGDAPTATPNWMQALSRLHITLPSPRSGRDAVITEARVWPEQHFLINGILRGLRATALGEDRGRAVLEPPHLEDAGDYSVSIEESAKVPVSFRGIPGRSPSTDLTQWLEDVPFERETRPADGAQYRHEVLIEVVGRKRSEVQVVFLFDARATGAIWKREEQARGQTWKRIVLLTADPLVAVFAFPVDEGVAVEGLIAEAASEEMLDRVTRPDRFAGGVDPQPRNNLATVAGEVLLDRNGEKRVLARKDDSLALRMGLKGFVYIQHVLFFAMGVG